MERWCWAWPFTARWVAALVASALLAACGSENTEAPAGAGGSAHSNERSNEEWALWSRSESAWREMEEIEKRIRAFEPDMAALSREVLDLGLPGPRTRTVFGDVVQVVDLAENEPSIAPAKEAVDLDPALGRREAWGLDAEPRAVSREDLQLWQPAIDGIDWFDDAKFKLGRGEFAKDEPGTFRGEISFAAHARLRSGDVAWMRATVDATWRRETRFARAETWRIHAWTTRSFERIKAPRPWFREVLADALRDRASIERARTSEHQELVRTWLADPKGTVVPEHFFAPAMDRHPGLAIADVDGDGLDDLYVLLRRGRNQLYRNQGDGSFEEIAAKVGLDLAGNSSSAIFADFDNDGDKDVVVGRTLARSVYLENRDGHFHQPEGPGATLLPFLASSLNAVDYDGDGLLDLYVSTYAARMVASTRAETIFKPLLAPGDHDRLMELRRSPEFDPTLSLFGPPNVMLRNSGGGRFELAASPVLRSFMNTYQASWADYDADGDPDVYLSNDFGPNQLLRNDGEGRFEDVTEQTGTADVGFGMGVSWGDYDEDGRSDLYVSNMYSTAGRRITERLRSIDPSYRKMARGNTLFRNEGETFRKVSDLEPPGLAVEAAGWSWGGQFVDIDNDGDLDLFALSGYYSAPPEFAVPIDT